MGPATTIDWFFQWYSESLTQKCRNAPQKLINYYMFQSFQNFYAFVKVTEINWKELENCLKIKQKVYPTNEEVQRYFIHTFNQKTANIGRSKWHSMDKILYIWVVAQYCNTTQKDMLYLDKSDFNILSCILRINQALLEFKWLKLIKPYIKNTPWSQAQDQLIHELVSKNTQKKWTDIAMTLSKTHVSSGLRTAKQVRQRWINYLDPSMKRGQWTQKQDEKLVKLIDLHGKKWSILGKQLKRTQNSIKNRFNSLSNKLKQYDQSKFDFLRNQYSQDQLSIFTKVEQEQQFNTFVANISAPKIVKCEPLELKVCGYRQLLPEEMI